MVTQNAYEMDQALTAVMPSYWVGHARIRIFERGFSPEHAAQAEAIVERLLEKHDGLTGKKAAEVVIKKMDENLGWL